MAQKFVETRILGTVHFDSPEVEDEIKRKVELAAGGANPHVIREMMKQYAWGILASTAGEREKEHAKLLICYSWWARALDAGIPKKYFGEFMLDHLNYLDSKPYRADSLEKWRKYGGGLPADHESRPLDRRCPGIQENGQ